MTTVTLPREVVRKALSRAYSLGQTYGQEADSESYKQNTKVGITGATFKRLVVDTCAALDALAKPVRWLECEFKGDPPLGYRNWFEFADAPVYRGVKITALKSESTKPVDCRGCENFECASCTDFDKFQAFPPIVFTRVTK